MLFLIILLSVGYATLWQPGETITYTGVCPSFKADNQRMYVSIVDGFPSSENIGFNNWNGSAWVWGGDVLGDIRTTAEEEDEPFITYDGQWMYFVRKNDPSNPTWCYIYKAQNKGDYIHFNGSTALGPQINNIYGNQYANYPSITQDGQKLYFVAYQNGDYAKIHEASWNGSDWSSVILLPPEINTGGSSRLDVCVTPDGSELYFRIFNESGPNKLAYSRKVGGIWQQWQYCDDNINPPGTTRVDDTTFTYGTYDTQKLYFDRYMGTSFGRYYALRSPVMVQPASIGQIKALYAE